MAQRTHKIAMLLNRVILGLLILVPGLVKLFSLGPAKVSGMLQGFGFPAPMVFAWILILSEILFGLAVLANYKLKYTTIPPIIILLVAGILTFKVSNPSGFLFHMLAAADYWVLMHKPETQ